MSVRAPNRFHFIVTADDSAWTGSPFVQNESRYGEHTDDDVLKEYPWPPDDSAMEIPAMFVYESTCDKPARVGWITEVKTRAGEARIRYEFDEQFPPIENQNLEELEWELDITRWELNRTHWAIKQGNLEEILESAGVLSSSLSSAPVSATGARADHSIFKPPPVDFPSHDVAIIMPFDRSFTPIYRMIEGACQSEGLTSVRADSIWHDDVLMQDVYWMIQTSKIVVADCTGENANVFYELGLSHALGKPVVPIKQPGGRHPFDVQHLRHREYTSDTSGLIALSEAIQSRLRTLKRRLNL